MIQGTTYKLLRCFTQQDARNFTELCQQAGYPTDLGGYYLRQLVRGGYVQKLERGTYAITPKGKQQLAVGYNDKPSIARPRLAVIVVAEQGDRVVVVRRKVQPFIGRAEWPAKSVLHGEKLADTALRVAKEIIGVEDTPTLVGFFRRIDLIQDFTFDDKLFAVHTLQLSPAAPLPSSAPSGDILAWSKTELGSLERPAKSLLDIYRFAQQAQPYAEHAYQLDAADLSD